MREKRNGSEVEVRAAGGAPKVRVCMGERLILETDALSVTGLRNLAGALERAAKMAADELERYWRVQQVRGSIAPTVGGKQHSNE